MNVSIPDLCPFSNFSWWKSCRRQKKKRTITNTTEQEDLLDSRYYHKTANAKFLDTNVHKLNHKTVIPNLQVFTKLTANQFKMDRFSTIITQQRR